MMVSRCAPEDHREEASTEESEDGIGSVTRRRFLSYASGLLGGIIGAALGLPLARFYVGNALQGRKARWLKLGPVSEVEVGRPHLFRAGYVDRDGWRQIVRREAVYVVTLEGKDYRAFSNICTHLGCPVRWEEKAQLFLCPCHNGAFSIAGEVVKGPPPRALDRFEHKVEDGVLYVRIARA